MIIGDYFISHLFALLIISGIVAILMSILLFKKRNKNGAIFLAIWSLGVGIWSITYAFEFAATDVLLKIFWSKLSYIGIVFCPTSFFLFTIAYSSKLKKQNRKIVFIVYTIAVLFIISAATNNLHHLHWKTVSIYTETNTTHYEYGLFFWLFFVFTYFCIFSGIVNLFSLYFKFPERYKSQIGIFIGATVFTVAGNVIYVFNINPIPGFDWTPISFLWSCMLLSINIFRYDVFNLVPFARNKLIDMMPDAVLVVDDQGLIADLNKAMICLMDKTEKELLGRAWKTLFPEWVFIENQYQSNKTINDEFSDVKDDRQRFFSFQNTPLLDDNGSYSGQLITVRNVTKHKIAENKIHEAYKSLKKEMAEKEKLIVDLDAFAHTVAHDLKNMLGAIITSADMLKESINEDQKEEAIEILDLIELSSRKTIHITHELLLLASVRQQEIKTVPLEMCHIVEEAIERNAKLIKECNAQIVIPENCISALGYGPWVEEVWDNYISNAIKYGGNPPILVFGSKEVDGSMIKYWIKDNGNGITQEQQERLFSKFTRLELTKVEGHGLGLSIVKRIVEKLGGTVGIESTAIPGEGSTFYFTLPTK